MFITVTRFSCSIFRIVKRSCIHKLQLGFVNVFIAPIVFISFSTLNVIHLRSSVCDVVLLKCCTKWAANESDFCQFLSRRCRFGEMTIHSFLESLMSVTYINSVTHTAFYFIDNTFRSAFTFVDTFPLTLDGREQLHYLSIKSLETMPRPIFAARSPFKS